MDRLGALALTLARKRAMMLDREDRYRRLGTEGVARLQGYGDEPEFDYPEDDPRFAAQMMRANTPRPRYVPTAPADRTFVDRSRVQQGIYDHPAPDPEEEQMREEIRRHAVAAMLRRLLIG